MRPIGTGFLITLLLAGGVLPASALTPPDCPELQAWGADFDPATEWSLNAKVTLPNILAPEITQPLFEDSALDWGRTGLRKVDQAVDACRRAANKAKDKDRAEAFAALRKVLSNASRAITGIERARAEVAQHLPALLALELDAQVLAALAALAAADEDGLPKGQRLSGPAARPAQRLANALGALPAAEIAAVREAAADRYAEAANTLTDEFIAAIAAASVSPDGILAVRAAAFQAQLDLGSEAATVLTAAAQREAEIVAALAVPAEERASHPIDLPACGPLFLWAEGLSSDERRRTPHGSLYSDFEAPAFAELFGKALPAWTETDLALAQALAEQCLAIARSPVGDPEQQALTKSRAGRSLGQLGRTLSQQRTIAMEVEADRLAVEALDAELATAPETLEGAEAVLALLQAPVLQRVDRDEYMQIERRIETRLREIAAVVLEEPIAALAEIPADLEGLKRLAVLRKETWASYEPRLTARGMEPFETALQTILARTVTGALPEYRAALEALPDEPESFQAIDELYRAATGGADDRLLQPFRDLAVERVLRLQRVLTTQALLARCDALTAPLDLSTAEAGQALLAGPRPTTLGRFVCGVELAGYKVTGYEAPGIFGSEHELAVLMGNGVHYRIVLAEAEVAPGVQALVGRRVKDANSSRDLTVQDWLGFADMIGSESYTPSWMCRDLLSQPYRYVELQQDERALYSCLLGNGAGS